MDESVAVDYYLLVGCTRYVWDHTDDSSEGHAGRSCVWIVYVEGEIG